MRCCIFGAGAYNGELRALVDGAFVIAADGGFRHLKAWGIKADLAVGDFDSLGDVPQGLPVVKHPVMKDETDMALAVSEGLARGCDEFFLFGGMGGRLDHTLANLALLISLARQGYSAYLVGAEGVVTALTKGSLTFDASCQGTVSVFSADDEALGVTLSGLLYPLDNGRLQKEVALGVSNSFTGNAATVSVKDGTLLVLWEKADNPLPHRC